MAVVAVLLQPVQHLPKLHVFVVRVPPPSPVVGVDVLLEVAVDVEEVVRAAVQVVVRVRVVVPW